MNDRDGGGLLEQALLEMWPGAAPLPVVRSPQLPSFHPAFGTMGGGRSIPLGGGQSLEQAPPMGLGQGAQLPGGVAAVLGWLARAAQKTGEGLNAAVPPGFRVPMPQGTVPVGQVTRAMGGGVQQIAGLLSAVQRQAARAAQEQKLWAALDRALGQAQRAYVNRAVTESRAMPIPPPTPAGRMWSPQELDEFARPWTRRDYLHGQWPPRELVNMDELNRLAEYYP